MSARIGGSVLATLLAMALASPASAQPKSPAPAPPPPVTVSCEFLEITATSGKVPSIDADLAKLKKKFKKPPFSSWNQFKLLMKERRTLVQRKPVTLTLEHGKASANLHGIVNKSQLRLTIEIDDAQGKNVVSSTSTFSGGDYLVHGHSLENNVGHLLALTCK